MFIQINDKIYNTDDFSEITYDKNLYVMKIVFKDGGQKREELTNTEFAKFKQMLEVQKIE
jgi:hypothetical protein